MNRAPTFSAILKKPIHFCAFGFGSGLLKPAPGTWGTLLACLLYVPFAPLFEPPYLSLVFVVITFIGGVFICDKTSQDIGVHDFSGIVWDEFVGVWLVLIFLPQALVATHGLWISVLMAFVLFRFFDILKPPPIKQIDRYAPGGFGIMIDDIVAGLFALALIYLYTFLFIH